MPVDLSIEETKRFSQWMENESEHGTDIDCWGATKLESLLYRDVNRGIKEAFFKEEHLTQIHEMHEMLRKLVDDFTERSVNQFKETTESCKNYRNERLDKIKAGETPIELDPEAPKIVLDIVPFGALESAKSIDVSLLKPKYAGELEPLSWSFPRGYSYPQHNFDGLVRVDSASNSYTQLFNDGKIEAVNTSILTTYLPRVISANLYEQKTLESLKRYLEAQKHLGVVPPLFVMVSLLGVNEYTTSFENTNTWAYQNQDHRIDRPNLIVPEVVIDSYDCNLAEVMKPIFDTIANAAKWPRSMMYDESEKSLHTNL